MSYCDFAAIKCYLKYTIHWLRFKTRQNIVIEIDYLVLIVIIPLVYSLIIINSVIVSYYRNLDTETNKI